MPNLDLRPASKSSCWNLPGIEKDTFYAAALYLSAAKGDLEGKPLYREPKTPEATRDFLDRLADCFARSKGKDARDHVSATAMVRNERRKKITLYVAKNQSKSKCQPLASQPQLGASINENEAFATELVGWFSTLASKATFQTENENLEEHFHIFEKMCEFAWSRLEHYVKKTGEFDVDTLERLVSLDLEDNSDDGWKHAKSFIDVCNGYQELQTSPTKPTKRTLSLLTNYAYLAGRIRKYPGFRTLAYEVETAPSTKGIKIRNLAQAVKGIDYLGRTYAAYASFLKFCTNESQRGYLFEHKLLESQEDDWMGEMYIQKINSWAGDLGLTDERVLHKTVKGETIVEHTTVEAMMAEVVKGAENKARVHCEMQLLMHFLKPGVEKCLDYFGCSKKSCWLCWQMILQNSKYGMKGTHRKLYPRWAFPFDFSPTEPNIASGLRVAYIEMLSLIQDKVVRGKPLHLLKPYLQTSARITRRVSVAHRSSKSIERGLFSFNPIVYPDRFHSMSLPALHLHAGQPPGKLRQVQVYGYKWTAEFTTAMPFLLNNAQHILAFQLLTYPSDVKKSLYGIEYRRHYWKRELFMPHFGDLDNIYLIYYRTADDTLEPNPIVLSLWRKVHGDDPEFFPWRGDVFIFYLPHSSQNTAPESGEIDETVCFRSLETLFKLRGPEYARKVWDRNMLLDRKQS